MSDAPTFGRYAEIPVGRMTPEQREGYRFLVDGPRGRLPGPYKIARDDRYGGAPMQRTLRRGVARRTAGRDPAPGVAAFALGPACLTGCIPANRAARSDAVVAMLGEA
jgi:hypothetical protein